MNRRLLAIHNVVRYSLIFMAFVLVGCAGQSTSTDAQSQIARLEKQVKAQDRKIKTLAFVATSSRDSVFQSPLRQFFGAKEFWEVIYEDSAACANQCDTPFRTAMENCEGASDRDSCEDKARVAKSNCIQRCNLP